MNCIKCGAKLREEAKFCNKCGQAIGETQSAPVSHPSKTSFMKPIASANETELTKLSLTGICVSLAVLLYLISLFGAGEFTFWTFLSRLIAPGIFAYLTFSKWKEHTILFSIPLIIKGLVDFVLIFSSLNDAVAILSSLLTIAVAILFTLTFIGKRRTKQPLMVLVGIAVIITGWSGFRTSALHGFMQILFYMATLFVVIELTTEINSGQRLQSALHFISGLSKNAKIGLIAGVALLVVSIFIVGNSTNKLAGTYYYRDSLFWVEFDGKVMTKGDNFVFTKGEYRVEGNTLILDVSGHDGYNLNSAGLVERTPYGGKQLVNGELTYSFSKQGNSIWIDGKEYKK